MSKQSSLSFCAQMVRSEDRDRFLCAMFAPARHREALFTLYAFNLEIARIRESVTEGLIGRMRLQWWRDAIASIGHGQAPHHPVAEALANTISNYSLSSSYFERLINSREADMTDDLPVDMAALTDYAEGTSVPLVYLSLEILGVRDPASPTASDTISPGAAYAAAKDIGIAWALSGLVRALPFHASANRFFVPQDVCRHAGIEAHDFMKRPASNALCEFVGAVSEQARQSLSAAKTYRNDVPRAAIPALLPATLAESYLAALKRAHHDPFTARVGQINPWCMIKLMRNGFRGSY